MHLLLLVLSCEDGEAHKQFVQDAAKGPHVNGRSVADSHHDLRSSVEPTLDIGIELLVFICATTEIDDFDSTLVLFPEQDVLWFEVAVDDVELFHVVERDQDLDGEPSNKAL